MGLAGALIAVPIATATMYIGEEFYLKPLNENENEHENENETNQPAT